jgi:hypothetical protein
VKRLNLFARTPFRSCESSILKPAKGVGTKGVFSKKAGRDKLSMSRSIATHHVASDL